MNEIQLIRTQWYSEEREGKKSSGSQSLLPRLHLKSTRASFLLGLFKPRFAPSPQDSVLAHPLREVAPQWIQTASVSMDTFSQPANERAAEGAVALETGRLEQVVLMNC